MLYAMSLRVFLRLPVVDEPEQKITSEIDFADAPESALQRLRLKRELLSREYAAGKLNAAQFNAMYRYYMEKSAIIEKLLERNPETEAWRTVAAPGATTFLKERFEARPLYCLVFPRGAKTPLLSEGKITTKAAQQVHKLLQTLWQMQTWRTGMARQSLGEGLWLLLAVGESALTLVVYMMQPSQLQVNKVRDLHVDFERANQLMLKRQAEAAQLVFPQRSLFKQNVT
jgi:hypothetical protein